MSDGPYSVPLAVLIRISSTAPSCPCTAVMISSHSGSVRTAMVQSDTTRRSVLLSFKSNVFEDLTAQHRHSERAIKNFIVSHRIKTLYYEPSRLNRVRAPCAET